MSKQEIKIEDIIHGIRNKQYSPVYYLMGDESYYIDKISEYMAEHILTPEEQEFNQTLLYGGETNIESVINAAKRYPMMSSHQVIIVKEAQNLKNLDKLSFYLQKPQRSTILVFCHKNGSLDRRKKITLEIEKHAVLYESKRLKESQLPAFIINYLKRKKIAIEPKACELLASYVGSDLCRLSGELDKLILTLPQTANQITPEHIEKNIGISKDFNNFELKNAIIENDIYKCNQIIKYFAENPKNNPLQMTLSVLFNFFSNLMLAYYAPQKTEAGIATQLGLRNQWQSKEYMIAMRKFSGVKVMQIIAAIRQCDAQSKGFKNSSIPNADLLKELIYYILH